MAQFVNKLRDCIRTVNLTMLLVLNLFCIVTLNLTVATVLVVLKADNGFFIQDGSISIGNIMLLIPGIALTNSIRDMFSGDTISGLLRFTEALVLSVVIALGFAMPTVII